MVNADFCLSNDLVRHALDKDQPKLACQISTFCSVVVADWLAGLLVSGSIPLLRKIHVGNMTEHHGDCQYVRRCRTSLEVNHSECQGTYLYIHQPSLTWF